MEPIIPPMAIVLFLSIVGMHATMHRIDNDEDMNLFKLISYIIACAAFTCIAAISGSFVFHYIIHVIRYS